MRMAKARSKAAYMISAVAEQYQIHPQTLRLYEREGLLTPSRSDGNTRLYTDDDLERLEVILKLTRDLGVNLAGVEIILNMREKMAAMQDQIEEFVATLNQEFAHQAPPVPGRIPAFADSGGSDAHARGRRNSQEEAAEGQLSRTRHTCERVASASAKRAPRPSASFSRILPRRPVHEHRIVAGTY